MADELIKHNEKKAPNHPPSQIHAHFAKLQVLQSSYSDVKSEANWILKAIKKMRQRYPFTQQEAIWDKQMSTAYLLLTRHLLSKEIKSDSDWRTILKYGKLAKEISLGTGELADVQQAEQLIQTATLGLSGDNPMGLSECAPSSSDALRVTQHEAEVHGDHADHVLQLKTKYVLCLANENQGIKAKREMKSVLETCRRYLGKCHGITKRSEQVLNEILAPQVRMSLGDEEDTEEAPEIEALRYDSCGHLFIKPTPDTAEEFNITEFPMPQENYTLIAGTPVMCVGLEEGFAQYEGKIGDIRSCNIRDRLYDVVFDDKSLGRIEVKQHNLRILFDFP